MEQVLTEITIKLVKDNNGKDSIIFKSNPEANEIKLSINSIAEMRRTLGDLIEIAYLDYK